jgi:PKD repeat protein
MFLIITSNVQGQFSFSANVTEGCAPQIITFTNTSSTGVHYDWHFGDGGTSIDTQNATHTFTNGGNFYVTMIAYDAGYAYLGETGFDVFITGAPSQINMESHVFCPNDQVNMYYAVPGVTSYSIDFGDGNSETNLQGQSNHTYVSSGTYNVSVNIETSGCGNYILNDVVEVNAANPHFGGSPYMGVSPLIACPNSEITANTDDRYSNISWDFDNGNFGSSDNEIFTYPSDGNYNVELILTNGCGVDTVLIQTVAVSNTSPVTGGYIWEVDSVCPGEAFHLEANSDNGVNYSWDFNDGNPAVEGNHANYILYTIGTHNVDLTITNDCGSSVVMPTTIVVSNNAPISNPGFNINKVVVCPGDEVEFSTNFSYSHYFNFGDGSGSNSESRHVYENVGIYPVSVTLQNTCGSSMTLFDTIRVVDDLPIDVNSLWLDISPTPSCPGDEIDFEASFGYASYLWDFGNGVTSTNRNTNQSFNLTGSKDIELTVTNGCGSSYTASESFFILNNLPLSNIDWSINNDTVCPGNSVFFESDEDDGEYKYIWDFGDGTDNFTGNNGSHLYDTEGTYYVNMTVENGCGIDSVFTDSVIVNSNYNVNPSDFDVFQQEAGCVGEELFFVVMPSGSGNIYWDFGDGNTTSDVDVVYVEGIVPVDVSYNTYITPGQYYANYTFTNGCGSSINDSVFVDVSSLGSEINLDVSFWWDETQAACQGQNIEFVAVGASSYIWDFDDGTGELITYSSLTPVYHSFSGSGTYNVKVLGVSNCGNSEARYEQIFIPESAIQISTNTIQQSNCDDNNGLAVVSASGGLQPYTYSWTNGDESAIADSLYSGVYVVTVTDNNGCSNEGIATVSDEESVTILVDNVVDVDCYGAENGSISISILGGQPPYIISWSNGDQTEDVFGLQAGPYEIFVTDANGCFAVESIVVEQPEKSNISIITNPANCGFANGSAIASVNNGTGPYNFVWPNSSGSINSTGGLEGGVYNLLVIDGNTCLLEKEFIINEFSAPIIVTDSIVVGTCNGDLSSIYTSTIGGGGPFNYYWSSGQTTDDITSVLPGDYILRVENIDQCSSFASFTVEQQLPEETTICMIDVDTTTGTNLVVWTPLVDDNIESYNIYKESSQSGLYYLIGSQSSDSISQYYDYLSDPSIRSWRYKVAAVDDCGNEAPLSDEHKTMHLTSNMGIGGEVNLIWDHYQGFNYPTYYINRWHPTTDWMVIDSLSADLFTYTDQNPPGDSSLIYLISIVPPSNCLATRAQDHNASRSNKGSINMPVEVEEDGASVAENSMGISLFPNPTTGLLNINSSVEIIQIRVKDALGRIILVENNIQVIDLSSFESGIYFIEVDSEDGIRKFKILKQ